MDRERKLLYTAVVLAAIQQMMIFAEYHYQAASLPNAALVEEVKTCHTRLLRTYEACLPKFHGFSKKQI